MGKTKSRIQLIDIAKGIAILMVVLGHTATNDELLSSDVAMFYRVMYSIHMPLFFFLSGMSMSSKPLNGWSEWRFFIRKDILTVAFPYLIWSLIYSAFNFSHFGLILYGSWQALVKALTLTSLWYLSCLFVARLIVEVVVSFVNGKLWPVIVIVTFTIGLLLPGLEMGYPWCFDIAFVATACILLGVILKRPILELSIQKSIILIGLLVVSVAIYVASAIVWKDGFTIMMMCKSQYGEDIGTLIRAVFGGFAVLLIAMLIRKLLESTLSQKSVSIFEYIGQYTMGIFILHKPFMQEVIIPVFTKVFGNVFSQGLIRFLSAILAIVLSVLLSQVISYYVPELIGIFSKDKIAPRKVNQQT